jgi:hypothetical protein
MAGNDKHTALSGYDYDYGYYDAEYTLTFAASIGAALASTIAIAGLSTLALIAYELM